MKFRLFVLLSFATLIATAATAQDDEKQREDLQQREPLEFRRESRPEGQRYSFEDYIQDLTVAARNDEPQPDNPVSQLAPNQRQEYKPLNPMTILKW
jgi:hypothetical protein